MILPTEIEFVSSVAAKKQKPYNPNIVAGNLRQDIVQQIGN